MLDSQSTASTLGDGLDTHASLVSGVDLSGLPPVYLLPAHLSIPELHSIEEQLTRQGAPLTYDVREAKLFLGAIATTKRAKFELQCRKLRTEEVSTGSTTRHSGNSTLDRSDTPHRKRRKLSNTEEPLRIDLTTQAANHSSTESETEGGEVSAAHRSASGKESETEDEAGAAAKPMSQLSISQVSTVATAPSSDPLELEEETPPFTRDAFNDIVKVVKLDWLKNSLVSGRLCHLDPYVVYEGKPLPAGIDTACSLVKGNPAKSTVAALVNGSLLKSESALPHAVEHATTGGTPATPRHSRRDRTREAMQQDLRGRSFVSSSQQASQGGGRAPKRPPQLIHQTTSEHDEAVGDFLPEMPQWVKEHKIYACERPTPLRSPNDEFIEQLKRIRLARTLTGDEIGVRAYSSSIASIAAYPHPLSSTREILALPGCDQKIASLFHEWQTSNGRIQAVEDLEADPVMVTLRTFYNIWGVGAITAREFYYDKGWRELDDIIEEGWHLLSRSQQIGLKYYDEFELKIPRSEVEFIAATVTYHAKQIMDDGIECIIVGGYRRGKAECGDVDMILSHRDQDATLDLVTPVVDSLERAGWITHTLTLNTTNSKRGQQTLPVKPSEARGSGFDTLDKALVVWQDPHWPTREADLAANPKAKNPNVHRRVDIIISPWRTIGCAVEGWTSGTTFNRDLRRYARKVKGWKFDSSGVRERGTGAWIDLEGWSNAKTRAKTWEEAERRVFDGFGLEYYEPGMRCTGW